MKTILEASALRQTLLAAWFTLPAMKKVTERRIVNADMCKRGVVISFDDGATAIFPSAFLYAALSQMSDVMRGSGPEELEEA